MSVIPLDIERRLAMSVKRRKARAALAETGYDTVRQNARGYLADAATICRAYLDMNEPMDAATHARVVLLLEAAIEVMDEAAR